MTQCVPGVSSNCGTHDTQTVGLRGEFSVPVCIRSVQVIVVYTIWVDSTLDC